MAKKSKATNEISGSALMYDELSSATFIFNQGSVIFGETSTIEVSGAIVSQKNKAGFPNTIPFAVEDTTEFPVYNVNTGAVVNGKTFTQADLFKYIYSYWMNKK